MGKVQSNKTQVNFHMGEGKTSPVGITNDKDLINNKNMEKKLLQDLEKEWEILRLNTRIALQEKTIRQSRLSLGIMFVAWVLTLIAYIIK